ncbi:MAG TPA: hypothetical protein VF791_10290 [Pyrinomonadaceae bacterium]
MAFALLFGIGIMSSMTAQAQWQNDRYRDRDRYERRNDRRNRDYDRNDNWNNGRRNRRNGRDADGYGNYGGSFQLRQTALNAGFADGVKEGRRDRQRGDRYDYTDESDFQKGTRDYSSRFGDRYIYQRYYREAFSHGYADGYAGY